MIDIEIDGKIYPVKSAENLLNTILSLGLDLPYFCWHPAMGSVGACRQCAVILFKDQQDRQGRIAMACMTPVTKGMRVALQSPGAREFRADILELLMTNHPHDCPVCEEGGECHLQDMTVMTGHTTRVYRNRKRTHRNQYLGPFINHEMNRCISCYRCLRFYRDYAGGRDLQVFGAHNQVYFGRHEDGVLENEFSGNLVEVCPTGVFTDKTFSKRYARKWDLQAAPSICVHCAVGCNISPGERYGELRRVQNRYHGEVNGYFLCDRGRFGYGFVNSEKRLRQPLLNNQPVDNQTALQHFKKFLQRGQIVAIGSPRASLEANFALRELVGADNFYQGVEKQEQQLLTQITELLRNTPATIPSLREVERADAIVILGEDITNTAPRLALAVRQAVRNRAFEIADQLLIPRWQDAAVREAAGQQRSPLFIGSCCETRLDDVSGDIFRAGADGIARFGFALAHALNSEAPAVSGLSKAEKQRVETVAGILQTAQRPLVITGTGCQSAAVINAAVNLLKSLPAADKSISLVVPECNSIGLALLGGEHYSCIAQRHDVETVVVLENDLYRRGRFDFVEDFLASVQHLLVIDHVQHRTAEKAELVLPAATFAESEGTLISAEGRAQRFFPVLPPNGNVQASWLWCSELAMAETRRIDEITLACCRSLPELEAIANAAPQAGFRCTGMKIPRQPHRYSGRTAMTANINVSEAKPPQDDDSALSFSMEGAPVNHPPALNPGVWAPSWNSNQAVNKFQEEIAGHLKGGDPGVRLFDKTADVQWSKTTAAASGLQERLLATVPLYHIFGSEELSVLSAPLAERVPAPYIALHPSQAEALQVRDGEEVKVSSAQYGFRIPVKLVSGLAEGVVGIPVGLPGMPAVTFNTGVTITKPE